MISINSSAALEFLVHRYKRIIGNSAMDFLITGYRRLLTSDGNLIADQLRSELSVAATYNEDEDTISLPPQNETTDVDELYSSCLVTHERR